MKTVIFCLSLTVLLSLSACLEDLNICERASGPTVTQTLLIGNFDRIALTTDATVYLKQGATQQVIAEGSSNVISLLSSNVSDGEWKIRYTKCIVGSSDLKLYITLPSIKGIKSSGSGDIFGETPLTGSKLEVFLSGSGDLSLHSLATALDAELSGSGSFTVQGAGNEVYMRITGSGGVQGYNYSANNVDATLTGSGDARIYVGNNLRARLSGSGNFYYKGSPTLLNISQTGSGRIIDGN